MAHPPVAHPLHEPEWLDVLLREGTATDQLFRAMMLHSPHLTAGWLDILHTHGAQAGVPGFYTLYDIDTFACEHQRLVDAVLQELPMDNQTYSNIVAPHTEHDIAPGKRVLRRRRTRVALVLCVRVMREYHQKRFERARQHELVLHQPFTPFQP